MKKFIKTMKEFLNEENEYSDSVIKTIEFDGEEFTLHVNDEPMKVQFYLNTLDGEPYIDINKIIPTNMLDNAVWVEQGGEQEEIADMLGDILEKTKQTTKSGYNNYILYNIIG
jgi:hypothetical protein